MRGPPLVRRWLKEAKAARASKPRKILLRVSHIFSKTFSMYWMAPISSALWKVIRNDMHSLLHVLLCFSATSFAQFEGFPMWDRSLYNALNLLCWGGNAIPFRFKEPSEILLVYMKVRIIWGVVTKETFDVVNQVSIYCNVSIEGNSAAFCMVDLRWCRT